MKALSTSESWECFSNQYDHFGPTWPNYKAGQITCPLCLSDRPCIYVSQGFILLIACLVWYKMYPQHHAELFESKEGTEKLLMFPIYPETWLSQGCVRNSLCSGMDNTVTQTIIYSFKIETLFKGSRCSEFMQQQWSFWILLRLQQGFENGSWRDWLLRNGLCWWNASSLGQAPWWYECCGGGWCGGGQMDRPVLSELLMLKRGPRGDGLRYPKIWHSVI